MNITRATFVMNETGSDAVTKAATDLSRDIERCFCAGMKEVENDITVSIDPELNDPESYFIEVHDDSIRVVAADELGAIYGIYYVSHSFLGVDPFWFWKDQELQLRECVEISPCTIESKTATFKLRGWFVNDEDLLTEWHDGGGKRNMEYRYYAQVVDSETIDRVCETCLRAGCNLIIPASFVDVLNPSEAKLIEIAVARGLYVTQHHIEPLGVSHFGFENYWRSQGENAEFSYSGDPDRVIQTWRAYAEKWYRLAGDKIVWQLGLRGKGDRSVWTHDKGITEETAGAFITKAVGEQWKIIRNIDKRKIPPATITLWSEMSNLMSRGVLSFPKETIIVFSDDGHTQIMQDDFYNTPRRIEYGYGVYYHVAYWINGPHLTQGTDVDKAKREMGKVCAKGDTAYAIINVCNVREHTFGIAAVSEMMRNMENFESESFRIAWAGERAGKWYRRLVDVLPHLNEDYVMQDGYLYNHIARVIKEFDNGWEEEIWSVERGLVRNREDLLVLLKKSSAEISMLLAKLDMGAYPEDAKRFHDFSLRIQGGMLKRMIDALVAAYEGRFAVAASCIRQMLCERMDAEYGKWENWYRGDKKENWSRVLSQIEDICKANT
ncbi:MAG: glycosyl hydrolase 115 family protein [Planctomycetes bacterium]|nr:glycosyl hydrolase 115 family protein [Planctomycetota bacterium]